VWVRIPPPAPIFLFGSRPMRPGAGDPLKPSGRFVGAPDIVHANSFENGGTSILRDWGVNSLMGMARLACRCLKSGIKAVLVSAAHGRFVTYIHDGAKHRYAGHQV
jgi:hypothetical protein